MAHLLYRCYAKINLSLEVLGKRDDGYHDLISLVHTIGLADDLRIDSADELLSRVEGLDIDPETNLVNRAARLMAAETGVRDGAELTLLKRIPAAAGLGGGSSDAATTLIGLNSLWASRLGLADLARLAGQLGSDVPFFVRGGAALMRGRGDDLQVLPPLVGQWVILVVPQHDLLDKTRQLYAALVPGDFSVGATTMAAAQRLERRLPLRADDLRNAFTRAAREVFPGLAAIWERAESETERRFLLSGAGPAIFALAADRNDARRQLARLGRTGLPASVARTVGHARASLRFAADTPIRYA